MLVFWGNSVIGDVSCVSSQMFISSISLLALISKISSIGYVMVKSS